MTDETKNLWDVILNIITIIGAAVAFGFGLHQWRRGQAWQRAEKLDDFITKFESDELLRLGTTVLDWTKRETTFRGRTVVVLNSETLLALRDYRNIKERPMFPGEQPIIRDSYDALIAFFERLELSVSTGLIDAQPAKAYFRYWLERLITLDRHPDRDGKILDGVPPETMMANYIEMYADPDSIKRLCELFKVRKNQ